VLFFLLSQRLRLSQFFSPALPPQVSGLIFSIDLFLSLSSALLAFGTQWLLLGVQGPNPPMPKAE
jgi:hypothetical protein